MDVVINVSYVSGWSSYIFGVILLTVLFVIAVEGVPHRHGEIKVPAFVISAILCGLSMIVWSAAYDLPPLKVFIDFAFLAFLSIVTFSVVSVVLLFGTVSIPPSQKAHYILGRCLLFSFFFAVASIAIWITIVV